jgi:hypothetical protein
MAAVPRTADISSSDQCCQADRNKPQSPASSVLIYFCWVLLPGLCETSATFAVSLLLDADKFLTAKFAKESRKERKDCRDYDTVHQSV